MGLKHDGDGTAWEVQRQAGQAAPKGAEASPGFLPHHSVIWFPLLSPQNPLTWILFSGWIPRKGNPTPLNIQVFRVMGRLRVPKQQPGVWRGGEWQCGAKHVHQQETQGGGPLPETPGWGLYTALCLRWQEMTNSSSFSFPQSRTIRLLEVLEISD